MTSRRPPLYNGEPYSLHGPPRYSSRRAPLGLDESEHYETAGFYHGRFSLSGDTTHPLIPLKASGTSAPNTVLTDDDLLFASPIGYGFSLMG